MLMRKQGYLQLNDMFILRLSNLENSLDRRGFMTHKGIPDGSRAARLLLKDYVSGKLLYCYPPPGYDSEEFQHYSTRFDLDEDEESLEAIDEENPSTETTSKV